MQEKQYNEGEKMNNRHRKEKKQAVDDAVDVCIEQGGIERHTDPGKDGDREYGIIMYEKTV